MSDFRFFPTASGPLQCWDDTPDMPSVGTYEGEPYICVDCSWQARGAAAAFDHHRDTGHALRGKYWAVQWRNLQFSDADASGRRAMKESA